MKRYTANTPGALAFLAAAILACGAWLLFQSDANYERTAKQALEEEIRHGRFNGVVMVGRGRRVLFQAAHGRADAERGTINTMRTRFRIGSITKPFTAVLALQLAQRGKLSTGDSICKYLREGPGDRPKDCPQAWRDITLQHLLSNTSGIPSFTDTPDLGVLMHANVTRGQILARFTDAPLAFPPGTAFQYSNSNYFLLGIVIEAASGDTYARALQRQILDPLGMHDTGVAADHPAGIARGHRGGPDDLVVVPVHEEGWVFGAGSIYSTAQDLLIFSEGLAEGRLLPEEVVQRMWRPVQPGYGYGWQIPAVSKHTQGRRVVEHGGLMPGQVALLRRYVDDDLTVIVLANTQDAFPPRVARTLGAITLQGKFESPFERENVPLDPESRRAYAGKYEIDGRIYTVFERDAGLFVRGEHLPETPLLAEAPDRLYMPGADGYISPMWNEVGSVDALELIDEGRRKIARKLH